MAAPQPPQLTLFPDPPLLTDDEDTYNARADDTVIAQQKFIPEINYALTWIGDQVTAVDGYRQAAATSASNAADSASAASTSKNAAAQSAIDATNNGKAQVNLAKDQVTLAQQAAAAAQSAAQAAGAAAGLPGGRVPFTVLQINSQGNVSWGDGLIDKTSAVPGQALMLGTGKAPQWAFPGQQIGDVLISARNPGALYLPANGGIRLKSAFPQLAALVGSINGVIGTSWSNVAVAAAANTVAASTSGTVIYSGTGVVYRSTDSGLTFGSPITLPISAALSSLDSDNNGNWIGLSSANSSATQICVYSNDDGLTWAQAAMPPLPAGGYAYNRIRYVGGNSWFALGASNASTAVNAARSTNVGKNWTGIVTGLGTPVDFDSNGTGVVVVGGSISTTNRISRSTDFGATFTVGSTWTGGSTISMATDKLGNWYIGANSNASGNLFRSNDDGVNFAAYPVFSAPQSSNVNKIFCFSGKLLLLTIGAPSGVSIYDIATQVLTSVTSGSVISSSQYNKISDAGSGVLIAGSATASNISRATPQFPYDTATQFALPAIPAPAGTTAYIKAKELA